MMTRRQVLAAGALGATPLVLRAQGPGTDWPNRPVKIVVGFPAGQASDVAARIYASELQKVLGQPFVVENRPGVGGTLSLREVARSAPDGYSLALASGGPWTVAPHLYSNLGFDPTKDLDAVVMAGHTPLVLLVRPDLAARTMRELVALSAKHDLYCGSGGNGVTNHLVLEMFKIATGAKLTHVPYKGAAPALTDLIGGQIQCMFETAASAMVHVRAGRLRALAVTSPARWPDIPDVPAVAESFPGFEAMTWAAFAVPRGTPKPIVDKLAAQLNKIVEDPAVRDKLVQSGITPSPNSSPEKARSYAAAEHEKWGNIIRRAAVKLD